MNMGVGVKCSKLSYIFTEHCIPLMFHMRRVGKQKEKSSFQVLFSINRDEIYTFDIWVKGVRVLTRALWAAPLSHFAIPLGLQIVSPS